MNVDIAIALGSAAFAGSVVFWIWAVADCLMFETDGPSRRHWFFITLLGFVIGAALYTWLRRPKRLEEQGDTS